MNLIRHTAFICSLLVFASCNQKVKEERIQLIDSLGVEVQHAREIVEGVDSVLIVNRLRDIDRTGMWVYDNITDTLERATGIAFGDYMRTKKHYNQALNRYNEVHREVRFSEAQIATLKQDVNNSFYSEQEFGGFFKTESSSVEALVDAAIELEDKYESSNERYEKFKPLVVELVDSIKSVIYAPDPMDR